VIPFTFLDSVRGDRNRVLFDGWQWRGMCKAFHPPRPPCVCSCCLHIHSGRWALNQNKSTNNYTHTCLTLMNTYLDSDIIIIVVFLCSCGCCFFFGFYTVVVIIEVYLHSSSERTLLNVRGCECVLAGLSCWFIRFLALLRFLRGPYVT
jgi:hypothetical protein